MFSAAPQRCSPYSPSSRLFLNTAYIDPARVLGKEAFLAALDASGTRDGHIMNPGPDPIDWLRVLPPRLQLLRRMHENFCRRGSKRLFQELDDFTQQGGEALASQIGSASWRERGGPYG